MSLAEVAEEVALSRYHFQRTFRRETGEIPNRFLNWLRVEAAGWHLANYEEVAAAVRSSVV